MPILNYTTAIKSQKTVGEITQILVKAKCQAVLQEFYEDGRPKAISFRINTAFGMMSFLLPANAEGVYKAMVRDKRLERRFKTLEQAERVAWRIVKDWTEAQCAMIEAGLADLEQVFLPYAQRPDGSTFYEDLKSRQFDQLALPAP